MADAAPVPADLPPVKLDDLTADRIGFAGSVLKFAMVVASAVALVLVLMATFLVR